MSSVHAVHVHPGASKHDISIARKNGAPAASLNHMKASPWQTQHYVAAPKAHFKAMSMKHVQLSPNVSMTVGVKRGE